MLTWSLQTFLFHGTDRIHELNISICDSVALLSNKNTLLSNFIRYISQFYSILFDSDVPDIVQLTIADIASSENTGVSLSYDEQ